jgi:hypothetical protein
MQILVCGSLIFAVYEQWLKQCDIAQTLRFVWGHFIQYRP